MKHFLTTVIIIFLSWLLYYLNGREVKIPIFAGYKGAFYLLFILGMIWCTAGPLKNITPDSWGKPFTIIAMIFGTLILLSAILFTLRVLFGTNVPFFTDSRVSYIILAILISAKSIVTFIHHTFFKTL